MASEETGVPLDSAENLEDRRAQEHRATEGPKTEVPASPSQDGPQEDEVIREKQWFITLRGSDLTSAPLMPNPKISTRIRYSNPVTSSCPPNTFQSHLAPTDN